MKFHFALMKSVELAAAAYISFFFCIIAIKEKRKKHRQFYFSFKLFTDDLNEIKETNLEMMMNTGTFVVVKIV